MKDLTIMQIIGALCFGGVIGWVLRLVLAFAKEIAVKSLSSIISAIAGGASMALFNPKEDMFACYSMGLAAGFFLHVLLLDISPKTGGIGYRRSESDKHTNAPPRQLTHLIQEYR